MNSPLFLTRLAHVCIETTQLEETEAFYRKLGARRQFEFRNLEDELIGLYLRLGEDTYLELVAVGSPRPEGALAHFALQVSDIDLARSQLLAAGVDISEKELGVDHTWMITCRDPNGVFIELHQYTDRSLQHTGGTCTIDYHP